MSTYSQLHLQLVTAVKFRRALIGPHFKNRMLEYQTGIVRKKGHKVIAINAMPDHLHLFIGKRPTEAECDLMRDLKSDTTEWINKHRFCEDTFAWQEGYAVFSYRRKDIPVVAAYIANQEAHHRKKSFREEIVEFLTEEEIPFRPEYLYHDPF